MRLAYDVILFHQDGFFPSLEAFSIAIFTDLCDVSRLIDAVTDYHLHPMRLNYASQRLQSLFASNPRFPTVLEL